MGDVFSTIWQGLVAGIIVGPLARLVLPGRQNLSLIMTIVLGAVGAIVGGLIYSAFGGTETGGIDWIRLAVQVAVGALAVILFGSMQSRRSTA